MDLTLDSTTEKAESDVHEQTYDLDQVRPGQRKTVGGTDLAKGVTKRDDKIHQHVAETGIGSQTPKRDGSVGSQ